MNCTGMGKSTINNIRSVRYVVVGGGILGLATARELLIRGVRNVTVLESESRPNEHQTGRNSGVVHAGLFYRPGSLKAILCKKGLKLTKDYCERHGLKYRSIGKLVVALDHTQKPLAEKLYENAIANEVPDVKLLESPADVRKIEPLAAGVAAVYSPHTAIVDWREVSNRLCDDVRSFGGTVMLNARVDGLVHQGGLSDTSNSGVERELTLGITRSNGERTKLGADRVVTCAGVYADRVAQSMGGSRYPEIVPIRGEYMYLEAPKSLIPQTNIYPLPPSLLASPHVKTNGKSGSQSRKAISAPFLGVHFTPTLNGDVIVGPNAVPAFGRTSYRWLDISIRDMFYQASSIGVWRLIARHGNFALNQMYKSVFLTAAIADALQYVPALSTDHFKRRNPRHHGIRAQAVGVDGSLIDDFVIESVLNGRILHIRNAPSPAATSALAIAEMIADRSLDSYNFTLQNKT